MPERSEPSAPPPDNSSPLALLERLALASVGAVALTAERTEELARDLSDRGEGHRDEVRQTIEEAVLRWRGEAIRISERAGSSLQAVFEQLGLVTREEYEELELRVAQLEHRLKLAESRIEAPHELRRVDSP